MAFNYFVHAQHLGAGDNCLDVPYHLTSPLPIHDLPMHAKRLLALLAMRNVDPNAYVIQCNSESIDASVIGPEQLTQDADYELYSNPYCEYVKIVRIQGINAFALSALNNWIPCTEIHLTNEQAYSLILPNNAPTA